MSIPRQSRDDVPVRIEIHISARVNGCLFTMIVNDLGPIGEADHHESAAAEITGRWMSNGEGKRRCDRRINRVAALFQSF